MKKIIELLAYIKYPETKASLFESNIWAPQWLQFENLSAAPCLTLFFLFQHLSAMKSLALLCSQQISLVFNAISNLSPTSLAEYISLYFPIELPNKNTPNVFHSILWTQTLSQWWFFQTLTLHPQTLSNLQYWNPVLRHLLNHLLFLLQHTTHYRYCYLGIWGTSYIQLCAAASMVVFYGPLISHALYFKAII